MSSRSSAARSWLPTSEIEHRSRTSAEHSFGWAPVADHVAEAPGLVDAGVLHLLEHGFERRQVRVDVAQDREAQGADYRRHR